MNQNDKHKWGKPEKIDKYETHRYCKTCGAKQIKTPYSVMNVRNGRFDVICIDMEKENLKTID